MSDRDDVKALLTRLAVPFQETRPYDEVAEDARAYVRRDEHEIRFGAYNYPAEEPWFATTPGDPGKVDGYMGFMCCWEFTPDGTFVKVGVWE